MARWTFIFIMVCVLLFLVQNLTRAWIYFSFIPAFAGSMPWMFVTSIFLHTDISHLFFNMFALFFFGIYLERLVGRRLFVIIFLLSGIVGNLGYALTARNPLTPGIGASGAIYGIMGTLAVLEPLSLVFIGFLPIPLIMATALWAFLDFAGLFAPTRIAHGAHLAGLFVGAGFGLYLRIRLRRYIDHLTRR